MPLNLVHDVFNPVAKRFESQCDSHSLRDFLSERYPSGVPNNAGIEGWFTVQVIMALRDRVWWINLEKGPDLVLRDDNSTVMVELKAATDLNTTDENGSPREGATKYCGTDWPTFAGCLFLGDGSNDSRIKKLSRDGIELPASRKIHDGERTWIVGLLVKNTD